MTCGPCAPLGDSWLELKGRYWLQASAECLNLEYTQEHPQAWVFRLQILDSVPKFPVTWSRMVPQLSPKYRRCCLGSRTGEPRGLTVLSVSSSSLGLLLHCHSRYHCHSSLSSQYYYLEAFLLSLPWRQKLKQTNGTGQISISLCKQRMRAYVLLMCIWRLLSLLLRPILLLRERWSNLSTGTLSLRHPGLVYLLIWNLVAPWQRERIDSFVCVCVFTKRITMPLALVGHCEMAMCRVFKMFSHCHLSMWIIRIFW